MSSMFNIIKCVFRFKNYHSIYRCVYSERKITESLGNVTVRGKKWKEQGGSAMANSLSQHV
jgi:hypothetical protein